MVSATVQCHMCHSYVPDLCFGSCSSTRKWYKYDILFILHFYPFFPAPQVTNIDVFFFSFHLKCQIIICLITSVLSVEPIVPQIATTSSPTMSSTSAEDIVVRSPGAGQSNSAKGALRLFSQPQIRDDIAQTTKPASV